MLGLTDNAKTEDDCTTSGDSLQSIVPLYPISPPCSKPRERTTQESPMKR